MTTTTIGYLLPERELRTFDREMTALVMEMQAYGWRGRMGSRGHAIMHAPDGEATASVSRSANRGRAGRNARRPFNQWLQRRAEHLAAPAPGQSFGVEAFDEELVEAETPPWEAAANQSTAARLEMKRRIGPWWDASRAGEPDGTVTYLVTGEVDGCWWLWQARPGKDPHIVAEGPHTGGYDAHEALYDFHPELRPPAPRTPQRTEHQVSTETETKAEEHVGVLTPAERDTKICDTCGKGPFAHAGALSLHKVAKHNDVFLSCPHKECTGRVFKGKAALANHLRFHPTPVGKKACPVRDCDAELEPRGMPGHVKWHVRNGDITEMDAASLGVDTTKQAGRRKAVPDPAPVVDLPEPEPSPAKTKKKRTPSPLALSALVAEAPASPASSSVLVEQLATLPSDGTAVDMVAQIRAIVTPPLVAEMTALRGQVEKLTHDLELVTKERNDYEARFNLMKEAMSV